MKDTVRWLLLKGALSQNKNGAIDIDKIPDVGSLRLSQFDERLRLLSWAKELVLTQSRFQVFLLGTYIPSTFSVSSLRKVLLGRLGSEKAASIMLDNTPVDKYRDLWEDIAYPPRTHSPLQCFGGKTGILEVIADYVGVMRGRELRILRQLADKLPPVILEELTAPTLPGAEDGSSTSDGEDSSDEEQ